MEEIQTKHTQVAACVVVNLRGEVVVVNQGHTSWSLPKGHVDEGETGLEAARREAWEEAGLVDMELVGPLGAYGRYRTALSGGDDLREHKNIEVFLFRSEQAELAPQDPENPFARWVPKAEVSALLTHAKDKDFFESIVGQI